MFWPDFLESGKTSSKWSSAGAWIAKNGVLQVTWFQHPGWSTRVRRLGRGIIAMLVVMIVSNARALYGIQPRRTFHRFAGGEGIQRGVKSEMARGGWDEFFAEQCRVGWVVADDVDMRVWHGRRISVRTCTSSGHERNWWTATLATSSRLSRLRLPSIVPHALQK